MKSEELFFEDLNFFRFFSLRLQKNAPLFFITSFFSPFSLLFFSLCGTNTNNQKRPKTTKEPKRRKQQPKKTTFSSSSSVKNYHNCLSLSSHFSFTRHDSLSSLSSFGARRAFGGVFFIARGGGRAKNNFEW